MTIYRVTLSENTLREFKVEANSREEAAQKYAELLDEGYFEGPLEMIADSDMLQIEDFEDDDPALEGVPTYEDALEIMDYKKKSEPFVEIAWSRLDVEHVLNTLGVEHPGPEMIEETVKVVEKQLKDMSIKKGWDIIGTLVEERMEQICSPVSRRGQIATNIEALDLAQNAVNYLESVDPETYRRLMDAFGRNEIDLVTDLTEKTEDLVTPDRSFQTVLRDFLDDVESFYPKDEEAGSPSLTAIAEQVKQANPEMLVDPSSKRCEER